VDSSSRSHHNSNAIGASSSSSSSISINNISSSRSAVNDCVVPPRLNINANPNSKNTTNSNNSSNNAKRKQEAGDGTTESNIFPCKKKKEPTVETQNVVQSTIRRDFKNIFSLEADSSLADYNPEIRISPPFIQLVYKKVLSAKDRKGVSIH
jgi:hypothetical protein